MLAKIVLLPDQINLRLLSPSQKISFFSCLIFTSHFSITAHHHIFISHFTENTQVFFLFTICSPRFYSCKSSIARGYFFYKLVSYADRELLIASPDFPKSITVQKVCRFVCIVALCHTWTHD